MCTLLLHLCTKVEIVGNGSQVPKVSLNSTSGKVSIAYFSSCRHWDFTNPQEKLLVFILETSQGSLARDSCSEWPGPLRQWKEAIVPSSENHSPWIHSTLRRSFLLKFFIFKDFVQRVVIISTPSSALPRYVPPCSLSTQLRVSPF